ncbi:MAG: hypothetical protein Q8P67_14590, partial [archaeon]|nr:hypothetical protein [archaeon]
MSSSGSSSGPLFECVLVVALPRGSVEPKITYSFPPAWDARAKGVNYKVVVPKFCFPDVGVAGKAKKGAQGQSDSETFSFVLTESDGSRQYAYCRRLFSPEGETECYCLLSAYTSFSLFAQILDIVEERRRASSTAVFTFLKTVLNNQAPAPGTSLKVSTFPVAGEKPDEYELRRATDNDYLLDYITFRTLFKAVKVEHILRLFDALLCERRVVLCSQKLGVLSDCITAFLAMLNPFSWQHTFIPVLPASLLDYTMAPMPFFIGLPSALVPAMLDMPLEEEIYIFDLDRDAFVRKPKIKPALPPAHLARLQAALQVILRGGNRGSRSFDLIVAKRFLIFFFHIFRAYPKYLSPSGDFDAAAFTAAQPRELQPFLESFGSIQMWEVFLYERHQMKQKGLLDQCVFSKMALLPEADLLEQFSTLPSIPCTKCQALLSSDFELVRGSPYCSKCKPSGFSLFKSLFSGKKTPRDRSASPDLDPDASASPPSHHRSDSNGSPSSPSISSLPSLKSHSKSKSPDFAPKPPKAPKTPKTPKPPKAPKSKSTSPDPAQYPKIKPVDSTPKLKPVEATPNSKPIDSAPKHTFAPSSAPKPSAFTKTTTLPPKHGSAGFIPPKHGSAGFTPKQITPQARSFSPAQSPVPLRGPSSASPS